MKVISIISIVIVVAIVAAAALAGTQYQCPMHPQVVSDKPGKCPICHMDLAPSKATAQKQKKALFYRNPMNPAITSLVPAKDEMGMDYIPVYEEGASFSNVAGYSTVSIDPEKRQLIGIKSAAVEKKSITKTIRAAGVVAHDEELYNAQVEFVKAFWGARNFWRARDTLSSRRIGPLFHEEVKIKLRMMGMNEAMIDELEKTQQPDAALITHTGHTKIWIYARIFSHEASEVKVGDGATIEVPATGAKLTGQVRSVSAFVEPENRTVKVMILINQPPLDLKPDMFVNVFLHAEKTEALAVPEEAVMQTGERSIAFVEKEEGVFEPREIKLGLAGDGLYEIKEGLKEGEKVVTSANFLIDSESRLKAAFAA